MYIPGDKQVETVLGRFIRRMKALFSLSNTGTSVPEDTEPGREPAHEEGPYRSNGTDLPNKADLTIGDIPLPIPSSPKKHDDAWARAELHRVKHILSTQRDEALLERTQMRFVNKHLDLYKCPPDDTLVKTMLTRVRAVLTRYEYDEAVGRAWSLITQLALVDDHTERAGSLAWYIDYRVQQYGSLDEYVFEDLIRLWKNREFVSDLNTAVEYPVFNGIFPTTS